MASVRVPAPVLAKPSVPVMDVVLTVVLPAPEMVSKLLPAAIPPVSVRVLASEEMVEADARATAAEKVLFPLLFSNAPVVPVAPPAPLRVNVPFVICPEASNSMVEPLSTVVLPVSATPPLSFNSRMVSPLEAVTSVPFVAEEVT